MELRVEKLVTGCKGLVRSQEGKVMFLQGVLPGELVRLDPSGAFSLLEPSPLRRPPICPYYGRCGGCDFQITGEAESARLKEAIVKENLMRLGKVKELPPFLPPAYGPAEGYRHRARFHVKDGAAGFLQAGSKELVALERCPLLSPGLNALLRRPERLCEEAKKRGKAEVPSFEGDEEVSLNASPVTVTVMGISYQVSAEVFFQSNPGLLPELLSFVRDNAIGPVIMDLYSGVGTFSALFSSEVYAVERDKACLRLSRLNAPGARSFTSDVALWAKRKSIVPDTVIVDPPRTGLSDRALRLISSWNSPRIIYVSCDSATGARDIGRFSDYSITKARVFDFYPGSSHEESAFVLDHKLFRPV